MWLGGDGIPMLCDVWRGFTVCALNFNEFPFFAALSGRENEAFSKRIYKCNTYTPLRVDALKKKMFMIMCMI